MSWNMKACLVWVEVASGVEGPVCFQSSPHLSCLMIWYHSKLHRVIVGLNPLLCGIKSLCLCRRDGRVLGVLEVSRSIGDGQYKRCGVISTPDLRRCQLSPNDRQENRRHNKQQNVFRDGLRFYSVALLRFIILACDGLFKVFSADEAVKFVLTLLQVWRNQFVAINAFLSCNTFIFGFL